MSGQTERAYETVYLCVDSYEQGVLRGRMYHPDIPFGCVTFQSLAQFIVRTERLLGAPARDASAALRRGFLPCREGRELFATFPEGKRGTFTLYFLFRENECWQGAAQAMGSEEEFPFRSILELVTIMDSALGSCITPSRRNNRIS